MKWLFPMIAVLFFGSTVWADVQTHPAVFASVEGVVTIQDTAGKYRNAQKGTTAFEGETVILEKGSFAILKLPDSSLLELKAESKITLNAMKQPTEKEKIMHFSLLMGGVKAVVSKLLTANSQFEIEAGGVVCGVRGTQFTLDYDPAVEKVDLKVLEGTVYAVVEGKTSIFKEGEGAEFLNGRLSVKTFGHPPSGAITKEMKMPSTDVMPEDSLALADLNLQFTQNLSLTGKSFSQEPSLGGTLNTGVRLNLIQPLYIPPILRLVP